MASSILAFSHVDKGKKCLCPFFDNDDTFLITFEAENNMAIYDMPLTHYQYK
jgi:hypothetical protein